MERQLLRARVTRVDDNGRAWVEVAELGVGQEHGPCDVLTGVTIAPQTRVVVAMIAGVPDDLIVVGAVAEPGATSVLP